MNTEYDTRARLIHTWWNKATGQNARLTMETLRGWMDLLIAGHNGHEVRRVLVYLLKEIRNNRRQRGSLALPNFLRLENFEKDLSLANMDAADSYNPDRRIPSSPEAQESTASSIGDHLSAILPKSDPTDPSATSEAKTHMASKLRQLREKLT
jgi:hypothetical protein